MPEWAPDTAFFQDALGFRIGNYGMTKWSDLFTKRQLLALTTFCGLVEDASRRVGRDSALAAAEDLRLDYSHALATYLALVVDKSSVYWCSLCPWLNQPKNELVGNVFGRQTLPILWDFAEANPFSASGGNTDKQVEYLARVVEDGLGRGACPGRC